MSTLDDYIGNVRTMIRDTDVNNPIYADDEIADFIDAGVLIYSRYKARRRPYTLQLVPGVSQYTLPSDWVTVDQETFDGAIQIKPVDLRQFATFVLPTLNAIPTYNELDYTFYDDDQFLIVSPAPGENASFDFAYFALHSVNNTSCTVPAKDAHAVVLVSSSQALNTLAIDRGLKMQKYKIGQGLQIDDTEIAKRMQEQAQKYYDQFERLIRMRPFGVMG